MKYAELIPLLKKYGSPVQEEEFKAASRIEDAVDLYDHLIGKMLESPEICHGTPLFQARCIIQLYSKLIYLISFPKRQVELYRSLGPKRAQDVNLSQQLLLPKSSVEHISLLATSLGISTSGETWPHVLVFAEAAWPFAEPTQLLLTRGGDERSVLLRETQRNKYHTSTIPRENLISRSSCTCSNLSTEAFADVDQIRRTMLLDSLSGDAPRRNMKDTFSTIFENVRERIRKSLNLDELMNSMGSELVLTPSGSDAELVATSAGISRLHALNPSQQFYKGRVVSILTAAGEVGSGSAAASRGEHFCKATPSGSIVQPAQNVLGFDENLVELVEYPARRDCGEINRCEKEIEDHIHSAMESTPDTVVLLHVVLGCKTGFWSLDLHFADQMSKKYPKRLLVVVDACQMRVEQPVLLECISKGYLVLITGSKFFSGSPFCGGVILPRQCVQEMEQIMENHEAGRYAFPLGYASFFCRDEFPTCMTNARSYASDCFNAGLWLRWESALYYMEKLNAMPDQMKTFVKTEYMAMLRELLLSFPDQQFSVLKPCALQKKRNQCETIVSFQVFSPHHDRYLHFSELRQLHRALSCDLSKVSDTQLGREPCLLGQPVKLGTDEDRAVIRIALSAEMMCQINYLEENESILYKQIENWLQKDQQLLRKIHMVVSAWSKSIQATNDAPKVAQGAPRHQSSVDFCNASAQGRDIPTVLQHFLSAKVLNGDGSVVVDHLNEPIKLAVMYDLNAVENAFELLKQSFPDHFLHHFAMKSCPLSFYIRKAIAAGLGIECASLIEVKHALRLGCAPEKIVFDSPCKTPSDIAFALSVGVGINADNFDEFKAIAANITATLQRDYPEQTPCSAGRIPMIGLRVNPLLGAGRNEYLSVSTKSSKFGIPLTDENRVLILNAFREYHWLTALHCHVGSQGCGLEMLAQGAKVICDLADEIDAMIGHQQVSTINIGGGLPANYQDDVVSPTHAEYASILQRTVPSLFDGERRVLTEFGRSLSAKTGWTISEVEYVKECGEFRTGIIHAGSELFLRSCYVPSLFRHRLEVYTESGECSTADVERQNVAGPLCFGGDLIGRQIELPRVNRGDYIVVRETGSNTVSMFSRHCSRPAPAIYGYRCEDAAVELTLLKPQESAQQVMSFWGE